MSFDQALRRAVDSLGDRLRHEASGHFEGVIGELHDAITREREDALATAHAAGQQAGEHAALVRITSLEARLREAVALIAEQDAQLTAAEGRISTATARSAEVNAQLADLEARARLAEAMAADEQERAQDVADRVVELESDDASAENGRKEKEREEEAGSYIRLAEGIRAIDTAPSFSALLDALAIAARAESAAAAVLVLRGDQPRSWRLSGFGDALDQAEPFEMPLSDLGLVAEAAEQGRPVLGDSSVESSIPGFASLPPGRPMAAVPVIVGGQVSALVYGEPHEGAGSPEGWIATLDILARHAARTLEAMTVLKSAGLMPSHYVNAAPGPM